MKAEFLQNFKVGDAPLPKEVIEAILAENGRDVEEAKKPFADYDSIKEQLRTATEGLEAFKGGDVKDLQGQVTKLTKDLSDQAEAHKKQLADLAFDGVLKEAITAVRGRNTKAIAALLEQSEFSQLQRVGGKFWDPVTEFAGSMAAGNPSGASLQSQLDRMVEGVTAR